MTSPRFVFFGGKGGVGKTTCAAAWAVHEAAAGRHVLVVSTDPAPSLGDALGVRLSSKRAEIRVGRGCVSAMEFDASVTLSRWLKQHRRAVGDVLEHGTWLDRDDIDALLELSIPGIDELMAMLEIMKLAASSPSSRAKRMKRPRFDLVVIDTAPTGHTLRLLAAPETVAAAADALAALQHEHRIIREQLARVARPEAADHLVAMLSAQASETSALLRDPARTEFRWVLLPEALSLAESQDGIRAIARAHIALTEVIVNRVLPDGLPCRVCDRRREAEWSLIAKIPKQLGHPHTVRLVRALIREPKGTAALAAIGAQLSGRPRPFRLAAAVSSGVSRSARTVAAGGRASLISLPVRHSGASAPENIAGFGGARLLLFGGKGGVGKTTVAAAAALRIARAQQARRILLISTDPAHSLGDVVGAVLSDQAITMANGPVNLHVRELDAAAALAARRSGLEAALNEIAGTFGVDALTSAGGRGVQELMDLAPPGIDELFGILEVANLLSAGEDGLSTGFDLVIVDTAPTGHALRLLEMPETARDWVQALLRVLLRYRQLVRPGQLAADLVDLSKAIRGLQVILHDPASTRFVVVTRAAQLPRLETERLMTHLRRLRLAMPVMVINAVTLDPRRCRWCRATARSERSEVTALSRACRRRSRDCAIILTPLVVPPRGLAALDEWASTWQFHLNPEP